MRVSCRGAYRYINTVTMRKKSFEKRKKKLKKRRRNKKAKEKTEKIHDT